jgi:hypothetical protein
VRAPVFSSVSTWNLTGSLAATNTSSRWRMPSTSCSKRVTPAAWRADEARLPGAAQGGPGVAPQACPRSSSRTKIASAVGSPTGSFANGVRRFSRLFSAQV